MVEYQCGSGQGWEQGQVLRLDRFGRYVSRTVCSSEGRLTFADEFGGTLGGKEVFVKSATWSPSGLSELGGLAVSNQSMVEHAEHST